MFSFLQMKVTGNNLTNICMVMYKVAKTENNDQLFLEEDMLRKSSFHSLQYVPVYSVYLIYMNLL